MRTPRQLLPVLAGLAAVTIATTSACGAPDDSGPTTGAPVRLDPPGSGPSRVVQLGDSVSVGLGEPLGAAFAAAGVTFSSRASEGGGNVVGPNAEETWRTLPDVVGSARPSTVVYQLTTFDWGTEKEQRAAYQRLLDETRAVDAQLVLVSMPPIEPDDFYAPHMDELDHAAEAARSVADGSEGAATFLDASAVWGEDYRRTVDGVVDRSTDGIHVCPQGAARYTVWLLDALGDLYPEFTPPPAEEWADTGWADSDRFVGC
ncbi:SGNH/GDSL hydrolase family protein [Phycicoccus sp. CSK15P-2]|uniref:SGNH/GDSL hydrolase family protein n=1 Tax=Phycicoccus sp. CSK15P-2 TaxID=2807627 RepID=UPI00194EE9A3|nr:SGNH/GDSL hydrolase family protein [Phycicoccus sp. CSK15P-2]MBM6406116.1 SGNH/GDSL hydrolase family protein [Phycicoccus sp. CSK15P-2]